MLERAAGEPRENEGFLGADILEDAKDLDLEFFDAVAGEDGASGAAHTGFDVLEGKIARFGRTGRRPARGPPGPRSGAHFIVAGAKCENSCTEI